MNGTGRPRRATVVATFAASAFIAAGARADTLDVPAEFPTIQVAIVAAQPGDTVLVAPGIYFERIDFLGKAITVEGGGAAAPTIDGEGVGSVVSFVSGEPEGATLRHFTIQGGGGSDFATPDATWNVGGGIRVVGSHAVVENCVITQNTAVDRGGGIFVAAGASLTLRSSSLYANTVAALDTALGGGLFVFGADVAVEYGEFTNNVSNGSGGGFAIESADDTPGEFVATGIGLWSNIAADGGGGYFDLDGLGTVRLTGCYFISNGALHGGGLSGWASATLSGGPAMIQLERCVLNQNTATLGGGLSVATGAFGRITLDNCLIHDNIADPGLGGGLVASGLVDVTSCTIADNSGGGLILTMPEGRISNSIVWDNGGPSILSTPPSSDVSWSDVQGGHSGVGNIDIAPHFKWPAGFGEYGLSPDSACLQAGDPAFIPPDGATDFYGDPRVLFGRVDIGADEATVPDGPWTHLGHALAGPPDGAQLTGAGPLVAGTTTKLQLANATPGRPSWIIIGTAQLLLPFKGGVMVPSLGLLFGPAGTGPSGAYTLSGVWPAGIPAGLALVMQVWISDPGGPAGFSASNGLSGVIP